MIPVVIACAFLVVGDTHAHHVRSFMTALSSDPIWEETNDPSFARAVHLGDFVDDRSQWRRGWEIPVRRWPEDLPSWWATMGNHDPMEPYSRSFFPLYTGECPGANGRIQFVSFTYDSTGRLGAAGRGGLEWARATHPDVPWIVFTHHPIAWCTDRGRESDHTRILRRDLEPLLPAGSWIVSGHEHVRCVRREERFTQFILSTGGGKRYPCSGHAPGNVDCLELPEYPTYARIEPLAGRVTYLTLAPAGMMEETLYERRGRMTESDIRKRFGGISSRVHDRIGDRVINHIQTRLLMPVWGKTWSIEWYEKKRILERSRE